MMLPKLGVEINKRVDYIMMGNYCCETWIFYFVLFTWFPVINRLESWIVIIFKFDFDCFLN